MWGLNLKREIKNFMLYHVSQPGTPGSPSLLPEHLCDLPLYEILCSPAEASDFDPWTGWVKPSGNAEYQGDGMGALSLQVPSVLPAFGIGKRWAGMFD